MRVTRIAIKLRIELASSMMMLMMLLDQPLKRGRTNCRRNKAWRKKQQVYQSKDLIVLSLRGCLEASTRRLAVNLRQLIAMKIVKA